MRIAKPMLIVLTPLGVVFGLREAWRLAGGLAFLMAMLVVFIGTALGSLVYVARRERAAQGEPGDAPRG